MYYRLKCECGKETSVSEGTAGVSLSCSCGRLIVVPELAELRRRAAMGEFSCCLSADGSESPPPNPLAEAFHSVFCWLVLIVSGLVALLGFFFLGWIALVIGITIMSGIAKAIANNSYRKAARAREREELRRLTRANERARAQVDYRAEPGPSADKPTSTVSRESTSVKAGPPPR